MATMTKPRPHPMVRDDALYFTDNGATLCGEHLGLSARYTGRDISGQPIELVTPEHVAEWDALAEREALGPMECEHCGKQASRLHLPS